MSRTARSLVFALVAMFAVALNAGAAPAKAKAAGAKAHEVVGTLEKFDPATKMLTVQTAKGAETLTLSSDAHIMSGSKALSAGDIASETGSRVKVSYTEANGQKMATDVRLAATTKTASAASSEKKPAKK